jgi:[CysO sulfur-carrier protein]-S-L-cysteine hydrolase
MLETLHLTQAQIEQIIQHLEACLPEEGCGVIGGRDGKAEVIFPVTNELHSPVRYSMDPLEQLEKMIWIEDHGLDLQAIFHSHPVGPETPSETDIAEFFYPGTVTLIFSKASGQWRARGFLIENQSFREIMILINEPI